MIKMEDIKEMNSSEIMERIEGLRKDLFDLNLQKMTLKIEKPHLIGEKKSDIARLCTALKDKK